MTLYAEFVVCFSGDFDYDNDTKDENDPDCYCGSRTAHQHISICEAYHGEMGDTIQEDLIFNDMSDTEKANIMAQMCRRAIKLNAEKPRKID